MTAWPWWTAEGGVTTGTDVGVVEGIVVGVVTLQPVWAGLVRPIP
jgi:hypothetical protein